MKSGSELLVRTSVLIRVCSENRWLRKASPKGGSIPLTLGYNTRDRHLKHEIKRHIFICNKQREDHRFLLVSTDKHIIPQSLRMLPEQLTSCRNNQRTHFYPSQSCKSIHCSFILPCWFESLMFAKFWDMVAFVEDEGQSWQGLGVP